MSADVSTRPVLAPDDRVAYSLGEVAVMLGKSPRTLKRLYLAGKMPAKRLGRSLMVPGAWVARYAECPDAEATS